MRRDTNALNVAYQTMLVRYECGVKGCVTYWGQWCFDCNVKRMDRISAVLSPDADALGEKE